MTIYKDLMPEVQRITRRPSHGHRNWFGSGLLILGLGAIAYLGNKPAMSESAHAYVKWHLLFLRLQTNCLHQKDGKR